MKRFLTLLAAMSLVACLAVPSFAQYTDVWKLDGSNWVLTDLAKVLKTGQYVDSSCNKTYWHIDVTMHASVAQWIHWTLNNQGWDWKVMKPGCYAANCITFWVASNGDVMIDYEGFDDLVGNNEHKDSIDTYYSWGGSPDVAEQHGWVRAIDLNSDDDLLDESELNDVPNDLHFGIEFKLFNKLCVVECNTACEYYDDATVTLILQQQKDWVDEDGDWNL